jgi:hypothetical protein
LIPGHPSGFTPGLLFQTSFFFAPAAEFPDEALGTELAVSAGVGACLTVLQTLPAVPDLHLLAFHIGVPFGMKTAIQKQDLPCPLNPGNSCAGIHGEWIFRSAWRPVPLLLAGAPPTPFGLRSPVFRMKHAQKDAPESSVYPFDNPRQILYPFMEGC